MQFVPGNIAGVLALAFPLVATAAPYVPTDDDQVLESLPRDLLASRNELSTLRRQLADDPSNAAIAANLAARFLQLGKSGSDPRFYGYARAALAPWWESSDAPPEILRLRAKLKEREHDYDEALADLKLLLEQRPRDAQAWIELANIYRVQGRYAEAKQACRKLSEFAGVIPNVLCNAPLQAVTGEARDAYTSLAQILPLAKEHEPTAVQWMLTMQAKIAWALGREEQAERHFREGLANSPGDAYLMRDYADFLLDRQRDDEALALLREHVNDNGILLRAAIAARRLGEEKPAHTWQTQLESRFEEIRLRGNVPHGRFESRCALELQDDPRRALELALANWQKQKEARDTRNVLEAAVAARDPGAAQPVLDFLNEHNTEDVVLQKLAEQLEGNQ